MNEKKKEKMRTFPNKRSTCLPVLGSMPKLALDIWAGGGDMNFDKEPNGAILSCKDDNINIKSFRKIQIE
jgi:hypothetical protein